MERKSSILLVKTGPSLFNQSPSHRTEELFAALFVTGVRNKKFDRLELAILDNNEVITSAHWACPHHNRLVQAYRAIKTAEQCDYLYDDTLCACYYLAGRDTDSYTLAKYTNSLEESGLQNPTEFREKLLAETKIPDNELQDILGKLHACGAEIDIEELNSEIYLGAANRVASFNFYTEWLLKKRLTSNQH